MQYWAPPQHSWLEEWSFGCSSADRDDPTLQQAVETATQKASDAGEGSKMHGTPMGSSNRGGHFKGSEAIFMIGHKNRIYAPAWQVCPRFPTTIRQSAQDPAFGEAILRDRTGPSNFNPLNSWENMRPIVVWGCLQTQFDPFRPQLNCDHQWERPDEPSSGTGRQTGEGSATTATRIQSGLLLWRSRKSWA